MKKDIGNYIVYSDGSVWSKRKSKFIHTKNKDGYLVIVLDGKTKRHHRILAECFIQNTENKLCVNHKNGIKNDNRLENLEWSTQKENVNHAWSTGLCKSQKGRVFSDEHKIKISEALKARYSTTNV